MIIYILSNDKNKKMNTSSESVHAMFTVESPIRSSEGSAGHEAQQLEMRGGLREHIDRKHEEWTEGIGTRTGRGEVKKQNVHTTVSRKIAEFRAQAKKVGYPLTDEEIKANIDPALQEHTQQGHFSRVIQGYDDSGKMMIYYNAKPQVEMQKDGIVAVRPVLDEQGRAVPYKEGATVYAYEDPSPYIARLNDSQNPLSEAEIVYAYGLMSDHYEALKSTIDPEPPAARAVASEAVEQSVSKV